MRLKKLSLKSFGPFESYELTFTREDSVCVLFTGKNNEGKSSIISALKLLDGATRVINQARHQIYVQTEEVYKLLVQDSENFNIRRMIHNYEDPKAEIIGIFSNGLEVAVYLDQVEELIYATYRGAVPYDIKDVFGFIPPLGPLSEEENYLGINHIRASINTSLAPRHLRNHLCQILSDEEFDLVREIVNSSWEDVELLHYEVHGMEERIDCFYKERRFEREISWAGQGLQVWFQIITHLVRLRDKAILVLDEPEINLHPEKQNDLIRILRQYYGGSIIIATHSIEMMNNVRISHIVNVRKNQRRPKIKSAADRSNLEMIRSQIGSNFNFNASQFEEVGIMIFTEDVDDFKILSTLAAAYGIKKKALNIPLHGFSEYKKAEHYKRAYELLIGKDIHYSLVLDRDYYPSDYLASITEQLKEQGIFVAFTPGKEIENLFLYPSVVNDVVSCDSDELLEHLDETYSELYLECHGKMLKLHGEFHTQHLDITTINKRFTPAFIKSWHDPSTRHKLVSGKRALGSLRSFHREKSGQNLSDQTLMDALVRQNLDEVREFIEATYQVGT
jgi:hypothetical protein